MRTVVEGEGDAVEPVFAQHGAEGAADCRYDRGQSRAGVEDGGRGQTPRGRPDQGVAGAAGAFCTTASLVDDACGWEVADGSASLPKWIRLEIGS